MNSESEMSSFLPTNVNRKKEKDIIDENFLDHTIKHNWNVGSEPLNEFSIQYLTSMSFPTLFPDGKGDPTNNAIIYNTSDNITEVFALKLKHVINFGDSGLVILVIKNIFFSDLVGRIFSPLFLP